MIDVVVPVYNAFEVTSRCLQCLSHYDDLVNEVYLINDASSDERIPALLQTYARRNSWEVLTNSENLGFVKTANIGLKQSENHTVLLNSDAFVTRYWLHGFYDAIQHVENLGTATPWSNNAEIASFPQFLQNMSPLSQPNSLSQWLRSYHPPCYPELPTAVGFCMLISQQAKQQVGYLDEEQFGKGYGEENDYSLRVAQAGLKNVLCDNSYVQHIGNQSFAEMGLKPSESTMQRLLEKHPNYLELIENYIQNDPLKELRSDILGKIQQNDHRLYEQLLESSES